MTDLSDLFPQSFKDDFAERNIQQGSVIRVLSEILHHLK